MIVHIHPLRQEALLLVVGAGGGVRPAARPAERGQQHGGKNRDDGDDYEKFNKRKVTSSHAASFSVFGFVLKTVCDGFQGQFARGGEQRLGGFRRRSPDAGASADHQLFDLEDRPRLAVLRVAELAEQFFDGDLRRAFRVARRGGQFRREDLSDLLVAAADQRKVVRNPEAEVERRLGDSDRQPVVAGEHGRGAVIPGQQPESRVEPGFDGVLRHRTDLFGGGGEVVFAQRGAIPGGDVFGQAASGRARHAADPAVVEVQQVAGGEERAMDVVMHHRVDLLFRRSPAVESADHGERNFLFLQPVDQRLRRVAAEDQSVAVFSQPVDQGAVRLGGAETAEQLVRLRQFRRTLQRVEHDVPVTVVQVDPPEHDPDGEAGGGRQAVLPLQFRVDEGTAARAAHRVFLLDQQFQPCFDGDGADVEPAAQLPRRRNLVSGTQRAVVDQGAKPVRDLNVERSIWILRGQKP
ncbi:hypothetical protein SDC9_108937 [bioreactor metagenome]|uniref:Uncharacterized protein n=1 Tax=bioreactor metagenome TaxID=1076179 RepID=A0A645BBN2_9ZZZZ